MNQKFWMYSWQGSIHVFHCFARYPKINPCDEIGSDETHRNVATQKWHIGVGRVPNSGQNQHGGGETVVGMLPGCHLFL